MQRFRFRGAVCVVTGAASGIGAALAVDLAERGSRLALVDRDADGLSVTAQAARSAGAQDVSTHVVDLADGGDRLDLAAEVLDHHGSVQLLVNNAGVALGGRLHQVSLADVDRVLEVNLRAVVATTIAFLPELRRSPGSHLVCISSLFGLVAPPGQAAYSASKFAVRGFTEAVRHELAPEGVGVTVVHPGGIRTGIATSARMGAGVPDEEARRGQEVMAATLTMPPARAARLITEAVAARRGRLVITWQAKVVDVLARLLPARYWSLLQRLSPT